MDYDEVSRALKNIQRREKEKAERVEALLAKEAKKWRGESTRRKSPYNADIKRAVRSANLAHGATVTIANATEAVGPVEDSVIYCTNSGFDTVATSDSLSRTCETDFDGVYMWNGTSCGNPSPKKKNELDKLLMDVSAPSLESLLM